MPFADISRPVNSGVRFLLNVYNQLRIFKEKDMSEGYVEFSKIVASRIREDGEEIMLTCRGADGGEFDMLIPTRAVPGLTNDMNMAFAGARIKQENPSPVPLRMPRFVDAPPAFITTGLSGVVYPESGRIDLQIEAMNEQEFVVALSPEHARALFDLLLQVYNLDDKPSS
jgi:hypothetical protein